MGGQPGAVWRAGKGVRRLMTKGIKIGSYVRITYNVPSKPGQPQEEGFYEGKLVDKRIGADKHESFVELQECIRLDSRGRFVGHEKSKRFVDAYIEEVTITEKREIIPQAEVQPSPMMAPSMMATPSSGAGAMTPVMMPSMMPGMMACMMPCMMPGMMPMPMMPVMMSGVMPGMMPGVMPGMVPNMVQRQAPEPVATSIATDIGSGGICTGGVGAGGIASISSGSHRESRSRSRSR